MAGPIYSNRNWHVEHLDQRLRSLDKSNILRENVFITLSSLPIVTLFRVHSILHLSLVTPFRWLISKTHLLGEHNWSVKSMWRMLETIEQKAKRTSR